jgi:hypothetical protein
MLICEEWSTNWKEYSFATLFTQIKNHPLQKECIDYLINNKIYGFKNEQSSLYKGTVGIVTGDDFSNFKYLITFQKDTPVDLKSLIFIHELTHIHYMHVQNCSKNVEALISKEAERFFNQNKEFSKAKYELATKKLWTDFSGKNVKLSSVYIQY